MSPRLRVLGDPDDLLLAGPPDRDAEAGGAAVVLGAAQAPAGVETIRWGQPGEGEGGQSAGGGERRISSEGSGLWLRAPWPAADALFDLLPPREAAILLSGGGADRRAELAEPLAQRGLAVENQVRLTRRGLEAAACVVLLPPEGAAGEAVPLESMAVLAAERVLLVPRAEVSFGLMAGIDHLQFGQALEAADQAQSVLRHWRAYAGMRAWGRFAAERHRASVAYRNLETDLSLEGLLRP
jgi:hypothetical protein